MTENWFTNPGDTAIRRQTVGSIIFTSTDGVEVFRIEPGGVLKAGPGLSPDAASQEMFASLARTFPDLIAGLKR
jgi:hypothetical protein